MATQATTPAQAADGQRRARLVVLAAALGCYAFAWMTYTRGQVLAAIVIAVFGYLLLRSRAEIGARLARLSRRAPRRAGTDCAAQQAPPPAAREKRSGP